MSHYFSDDFDGENTRIDITKINIDGFTSLVCQLEFRGLSLIAGYNGTGKSLINKLVWYCMHLATIPSKHQLDNIQEADSLTQKYVSDSVDFMFDTRDFDVSMTYDNKTYSMRLKIEQSELIEFDLVIHEPELFNLIELEVPKYASTVTRLFPIYDRYVKILKEMGVTDLLTTEDTLKLKGYYRLYDLMYLEEIRIKCMLYQRDKQWIDLTEFSEAFSINSLRDKKLLIKRSIPYIYDGIEVKKISSLGDGVQALIMMNIFISYSSLDFRKH